MGQLTLVKQGKKCSIWSDGKNKLLKIEGVRCSFPALGTMKEQQSEDGNAQKSYQITPMLKKSDPAHVEMKDFFVEIMNDLLAANGPKPGVPAKVPPEYRCIKNGDDKDRPEYEGHWVISCSDKNKRPRILNVKGVDMIDTAEIDNKFYGGCYVSVMLRPWYFNGTAKGQTKTFPKRICCGMTTVQFVRDAEPFGEGRVDDSSAWGGAPDDTGNDEDDGLGGGGNNDDDKL